MEDTLGFVRRNEAAIAAFLFSCSFVSCFLEVGDQSKGRPKVSNEDALEIFVALPVAETIRKRLVNEILRRTRVSNRFHHQKVETW